MHRLHLLITGLCPDFGTQTEAALSSHALPALRQLLGRGRSLSNTQDSGLSQRLGQLYQLPTTSEWPFAPLRLQADGVDPGDAQWWCADPVHMQLMLDHLRLGGGSDFSLDADEAAALLATLQQHLAGEVNLLAPAPTRWYARFTQPIKAQTTPLDQARGQSVRPNLPRGPDGGKLQRLMNEAQMLLHDHPVNLRREDRGQETVNSLWFWGGGQLAIPSPLPGLVLAEEPLALALAAASGTPSLPLPQRFDPAAYGHTDLLVVLDSLWPLSCDGRIEAWQQALSRLEEAWFKPILDGLKTGHIREVRLESLGAGGQSCQLGRTDIWKFWRKPGTPCLTFNR
jgi:hypothetical protein